MVSPISDDAIGKGNSSKMYAFFFFFSKIRIKQNKLIKEATKIWYGHWRFLIYELMEECKSMGMLLYGKTNMR
jgi:hypothetical protein